MVMFSVDTVSL